MRFGPDWKRVLRKSWSLRLIAVSVLLAFLDLGAVFLEYAGLLADRPDLSLLLRSLSSVFGVAAFIARLVAQKELK